ncbi:MAG: tetrahydromethanopterin S-methyltransferase subunit A [Thermoproteota archaeon]|nr:tetrahydromethanopterin S-methyltransferase subunit A [Thermoproteota archaeon]
MLIVKRLEKLAGQLCEVLLPIKQEYYLGNGKALAICTLSSIDLLETISRSPLMEELLIAGRLLSENKGIDAIIAFAIKHSELKRILLCGNEVKGHRPGQALLALSNNGVDLTGRIIGAVGRDPIVRSSMQNIEIFRHQVQIIDLIGIVDIGKIAQALVS